MQKTYVVAPNFSIGAPPKVKGGEPILAEGRYQLGDIVTDPFGPKPSVLNRYQRTPIPDKYLDAEPDDKSGVGINNDSLWSVRIGFWASLLAGLGIGGPALNVSVHAESQATNVLTIANLETREFDPHDDYVRDVLASEPVDAYIKEFGGGGNAKANKRAVQLYMISGLKIAKGASSTSSTAQEASGSAGASAAAKTEAKLVDLTRKRTSGVSFEKSNTDFVLAFQLLRIRYDVETRALTTETSTKKGALAGASAASGAVHFQGVDRDFSGAERAGREVLRVGDEQSPVVLLIPELE
jgi:hypothetical protein